MDTDAFHTQAKLGGVAGAVMTPRCSPGSSLAWLQVRREALLDSSPQFGSDSVPRAGRAFESARPHTIISVLACEVDFLS